jgi:hypothetical protein
MRVLLMGCVLSAVLLGHATRGGTGEQSNAGGASTGRIGDEVANAAETCAEGGERTTPGLPIDLKLDKPTAIQLAETILVKIYGKEVLDERPWIVKETKTCFTISGTWKLGPNAKGGVAVIQISRKTAAVLAIIHGR